MMMLMITVPLTGPAPVQHVNQNINEIFKLLLEAKKLRPEI